MSFRFARASLPIGTASLWLFSASAAWPETEVPPPSTANSVAPAPTPAQPVAGSTSPMPPTTEPAIPTANAATPAPQIVYVFLPAPQPMASRDDPSTFHLHDRLYLRMSAGLGYFRDGAYVIGENRDFVLRGPAPVLQFQFGGTPARGLVVGGLAGLSFLLTTTYEDSELSTTTYVRDTRGYQVGPFIDYYPEPTRGLHFSGAITLSYVASGRRLGNIAGFNATGFAFTPGVGYDVWIADQWSFGAMLLIGYAKLADGGDRFETTFNHNVFQPSLLGTFTYH